MSCSPRSFAAARRRRDAIHSLGPTGSAPAASAWRIRGRGAAARSGVGTRSTVPPPPMAPIGYITDHYPATSHTFVQREVLALRRHGVDVRTFSIHRVSADHVLSESDRDAVASTPALLPVT